MSRNLYGYIQTNEPKLLISSSIRYIDFLDTPIIILNTNIITPFIITTKIMKYLGTNLNKKIKDLYSENHKILIKKIEDDTTNWKIFFPW